MKLTTAAQMKELDRQAIEEMCIRDSRNRWEGAGPKEQGGPVQQNGLRPASQRLRERRLHRRCWGIGFEPGGTHPPGSRFLSAQ